MESFESAKRKSSNVLNSGEKVSESGSLSDSSPRLGSPQHQEQPESSVSEAEVGDDSSQPGPQDPVAAAYGDGAHAEKLVGEWLMTLMISSSKRVKYYESSDFEFVDACT